MCLGCGLPGSGAACNYCAGVRQGIKWGGNYRNWGGSGSWCSTWRVCLWLESWCCCSLLGPFERRNSQKSGIEKSCGWELPGVPQGLEKRMSTSSAMASCACGITGAFLCYGDWQALFRALSCVCAFSLFHPFEVLQGMDRWTCTMSSSEAPGGQSCLCCPLFSLVVKEPVKIPIK